jgi:hypothetical protein
MFPTVAPVNLKYALFALVQQFRKYIPLPTCAGAKFTAPVPLTTTVPVNPAGAVLGVTIDPFVTPLTSEASAWICRSG